MEDKGKANNSGTVITGLIIGVLGGGLFYLLIGSAHLALIIGSAVVALYFIMWHKSEEAGKKMSTLKDAASAYNRVIYDEFRELGATQEERRRNIDAMFDRNDKTMRFQWFWIHSETYYANNVQQMDQMCFKKISLTRSLASMEPREREFLRIAYHLYNEGKLTDENFCYYLFCFVHGNGKAGIAQYQYHTHPQTTAIKDGPTMLKYFTEKWLITVDAGINLLLERLEKLKLEGNVDKALKKLVNRVGRTDGWFGPEDVESGVFKEQDKFAVSLGVLDDSEIPLTYSGEGSLVTIAPPGSGKTQCFVIPNMLTWQSAAVVLDIKGEIYDATHRWRRQHVGDVYKFNPLDPGSSNNYNPLTFVRDDPDYIWEDARLLAEMMIVPSTNKTENSFWEDSARDVLTAAIAHTVFNNDENDRAMGKVLDIIYGIGWQGMIQSLQANTLVGAMKRMGHSLASMKPETLDSILKTAQTSLSAWQGERISRVTGKSDWSPQELRNGSITIYICINPNEIDAYLSVLRVFIAQHIRMLTTELPKRGATPVLFMLDELPRLKKMAPVEEALNIGRQYGIKLWLFAQSYGQLKDAYSDPDGLIGSCVVRTFMNLPPNDELTTKLSDWLGHRNDSLSTVKEKIVEAKELSGPEYSDLVLVLATGSKPVKVKKQFAFQNPELATKMNIDTKG